METHHETKEDMKNKLPRGDEINSFDRHEWGEFQNNRNQQATVPLPKLPLEKEIEE